MWFRRSLIVLALFLFGCTANEPDSGRSEPATDLSNPLMADYPLAYPGPPATVGIGDQGTLHIDTELMCVTLDDRVRGSRVVAFSEERAAIVDLSDPMSPAVIVDGCRLLHDGDQVSFYGAGVFPDRGALEELIDPADLQRCGASVEDLLLVGDCDGPSRLLPPDHPGVSP